MRIFMITGPSGIGKTHLGNELAKLGVHSLVVYTDRKRRPTEEVVIDREYLSKSKFTKSLGEFIYWFEFQGNRYGYKLEDVQGFKNSDQHFCFNIPPAFGPFMIEKLPKTITIYLSIEKDNFKLLRNRMIKRDVSSADTKENVKQKKQKIEKRLQYAWEELERYSKYKPKLMKNPLSRTFNISDDEVLYDEVIPYVDGLV